MCFDKISVSEWCCMVVHEKQILFNAFDIFILFICLLNVSGMWKYLHKTDFLMTYQ